MKTAIFASIIASAAAFAPVSQKSASTSLAASFENEVGAQAPLGFFDPFGVVQGGDQETFDRLRYVEIKHGRIAMLAVAGYLTTAAGIRLPGDLNLDGVKFADVPSGFGALSAVGAKGIWQIILFIGILETSAMKDVTGNAEFVGDFRNGFIDFGWDSFDDATKLKKRAIELNNGRAAQMGILALMVHEQMGVSLLPGN